VAKAPIIGSTLVKSQLPPLEEREFDTVIIDEASQASVTLALLAMVKTRKWVLVGDHKQLQPIFRTLRPDECEWLSAFNRLYRMYGDRSLWLERHYRSNVEIANFMATYIYEGRIKPADVCWQKKLVLSGKPRLELLDPEKPLVFVDVRGIERRDREGSVYNPEEASAAEEIVRELVRLGVKGECIAVITPYRAQRGLLRKRLGDIAGIEVDTVDAFQGREKDVVVFSVTSTRDLNFAAEPHRLTVALSRARLKMIVVGHADAVLRHGDSLLYRFYQHCKERGWVYEWGSANYRPKAE